MTSFDHRASPVLTLTPQHPPQPAFNMAASRPTFSSPFLQGINQSSTSSWSNLTPTSATPSSAAGRKRSRDEAAPNLEDDYFLAQPTSIPEPENEDDWEYGEGMTLIKPKGSGYIISAGSQTGTWAEEKADEKTQAAAVPILERPMIRAAKSQRLNLASTPTVMEEELMSNGTLITPTTASPTNGIAEPIVDEFTRHLGIGWSLLSQDSDIQAAARGWTKFINNHYPVTDARIRLQSRGLASYLVETNEGYFLFGEDLKQGRLVSTTLDRTWINLRGAVPIFDGDTVLEASQTPKAIGSPAMEGTMNGREASIAHGLTDPTETTFAVEMDMS